MNTKLLLKKLGKKFPKRIAKENQDYVGLMCGKLPEEVNKVVLCLDLDNIIIDDVLNINPDLVITHHPFIYGKKRDVLKHDEFKKQLIDILNKHNIPVYSFHTNFDQGIDGMNDALAEQLCLSNIKPLETLPMARGGTLPKPMDISELANFIMKKLSVSYCTTLNYGKKEISKIAIIGGGGWFGFSNAQKEGFDAFISGDIPHHGRRDIVINSYNYIDIPHEVERIFMAQMEKVLLKIDNNLIITKINHEKEPNVYINLK